MCGRYDIRPSQMVPEIQTPLVDSPNEPVKA